MISATGPQARPPAGWQRLAISMLAAAFATAACGGQATTPNSTSTATSRPSVAESVTPSVTPLLFGCSQEAPCNLEAGTYETSGQYAFLRGLRVTVPAGWFSDEQDAGEFNLHPVREADASVSFWKDLTAVANDPAGTPVAGVSGSPDSFVSWLRSNTDLVVTEPRPTMIGRLAAVTLDIQVASTAKGFSSDCPPGLSPCVSFMRDVDHWDGPYSLFRGEILRAYFAAIGPASDHIFIVGVHAPGFPPSGAALDGAALEAFTERVGPILDSVVIPDVIVDD